jgi:D-lactate dehydrogenase
MKKYIERLAWGTDAGFYRMIPEEVLMPCDESEVAEIIARARKSGKSITFRAAGTSLSGQAITDSLLVVCGKKWERIEVLDGGSRVKVQPGVVGGALNAKLKPYGRKFTPDPASINSAMVGGIVMNNASGMCCGTHANSERMIESARLVFADGTVLDTGDESSRREFAQSHPDFMARLAALRDRVRGNDALKSRILAKYSIKNVTGLTLLPLAECDDLFEIILRLIPGSEGTLAFLSEAVFRTAPIMPRQASSLLLFASVREACEAVAAMKRTGVLAAAEFFDRKAMRAVENDFPELKALPEDAGAVLAMIEAADDDGLSTGIAAVAESLKKFRLVGVVEFSSDPTVTGKYWAMRSGIFPAVGGMRETGTTCLIEDVAVPVDKLADFTDDLHRLLVEYGYPDAVIYGHALEGNWHFILNQSFDTSESVRQYDRMMRAVVELVTDKYDGSLKAEHGTGRNMAPFVRKEWGDEAYLLMKEVKDIFDPDGIFNPGVIFNDDPDCHISRLKPLPELHPLVDRCIECGFCEVNCVSCGFALSSRQRIVVSREIARLEAEGVSDPSARKLARELKRDFRRMGDSLCAGDGLCATSCPVKVNVGEYIHCVRDAVMSAPERRMAQLSAKYFARVASLVAAMLDVAALAHRILGDRLMTAAASALHKLSAGRIPLWNRAMPRRARIKAFGSDSCSGAPSERPKVVYFPSCINQRMGPAKGDMVKGTLVDETVELLAKAGYDTIFPPNREKLCCGLTWESKGRPEIADAKTAELEAVLREVSENGKWPILFDQSPCLMRMRHKVPDLPLYEPAEFIGKFVLDKVHVNPEDVCVAVHITCSTRKMGLADELLRVARACVREVIVPEGVGCCAFAGDKGFTNPELNAWALRKLRENIVKSGAVAGYSNSRTCEIGLSLHSGIPYMGIAHLVNRVSSPKG